MNANIYTTAEDFISQYARPIVDAEFYPNVDLQFVFNYLYSLDAIIYDENRAAFVFDESYEFINEFWFAVENSPADPR